MADDEWRLTELKSTYTPARTSLFTILQEELL